MSAPSRPGPMSAGGAPVSPWWRRAYRQAYWFRHDRRLLAPLAGIRTVVAFGASLGDNLLCGPVLNGLRAAGRGPLAMLTPFPDLFDPWPFPLRVLPFSPDLIATLQRRGPELVLPHYGRFVPERDRHEPIPDRHMLALLCRSAGLAGQVALKPIFPLRDDERRVGAERGAGRVLVQSSAGGAAMPSANKEWPRERWADVARALAPRFALAQVGLPGDPLLPGVEDWRARWSRREMAAILAGARLYVGPEGFLMHLARAVDCRSVIVLGGRTAPEHTCYPENANLYRAVPCAPCWQRNRCDHGRMCLDAITPADVVAAVERQLTEPRLGGAGSLVSI